MEQVKPSLIIGTEALRNRHNQLKAIIDELENLKVLVGDNLGRFRQDLQSVNSFCQGDFKFSFLVQGEMNAGKSTCLNALLGERILAVSCVPETNFLTCVIPDRAFDTPCLYKISLDKIYNSQTSIFSVNENDLEFTGVSGTQNIYKHLNKSNQLSRDNLKKKFEEIDKNNRGMDEQEKQELYKDTQLTDTVYVIKCRIPWLEQKIQNDFILKRIQFIDFPGMFEYGRNKIMEIYKIFEDNSQGVIRILDSLGYESRAITKLQDYKKYPNRMLIIVNKMDKINIDEDNDDNVDSDEMTGQEKSKQLLKGIEDRLRKTSEKSTIEDQKMKYLDLSKEAHNIIHFVTGMEELMNTYALKCRNSTNQQEKIILNTILKECVGEDQQYSNEIKKAEKANKLFADSDLFDDISNESSLLEKVKDNLKDKFHARFTDLVFEDFTKKLNSIQERLTELIEKLLKEKEKKNENDNTHTFYKCDGCEADPIVGVRYHCEACDNFDFCEKCKKEKAHPAHEFTVVPKEDLKAYLLEFSKNKIQDLCQRICDYKKRFYDELFNKFIQDLADIYKTSNNKKQDVQNLFKTCCANFSTLKNETLTVFKENLDHFVEMEFLIGLKWAAKQGGLALILTLEAQNVIKQLANVYYMSLNLLVAASANLLKAAESAILRSSELTKSFLEGFSPAAILLTDPYEIKKKVDNYSDLCANIGGWQNHIQEITATVIGEVVENSNKALGQINISVGLGEVLQINFEDDEQVEELNNKLKGVLEKLKEIVQL